MKPSTASCASPSLRPLFQTATADFRRAKWTEQAVNLSDGKVVGEVTVPDKGHLAIFGELDYEIDGLRYRLSTQMRMTE